MKSKFTKTSSVLAGAAALLLGTSSALWAAPMVNKSVGGPQTQAVVNIGGGVESINSKAGFRIEGDATIYSKNRKAGLRIDAANLTSEERRELTRALVSIGFKLPDSSKLILSGGYLNRYHEDSFGDGVGTKGEKLDQSVFGLKLTHQFSPITAAYLTALHFQADSELVHTQELVRNNEVLLKGYGFGGGTQTDILVGFETASKEGKLEIGAGLQRKKFETFLGNTEDRDFRLKARIKGTIYPTKRSAATFATEIASDQKNVGVELTHLITGPWSMTARADIFRRDGGTDDRQFYLGVTRNFGGDARIVKPTELGGDGPHWLTPVNGADTEHIQVVRSVEGVIRVAAKEPVVVQFPTGSANFDKIVVGNESAWKGNVAKLFTEAGDAIIGYEFTSTNIPAWVSPVIATNGDIRLTGTSAPGNYAVGIRARTARGLVSGTATATLMAVTAPTLVSNDPVTGAATASSIANKVVPVTQNLAPRFDTGNGEVTYVKTAGPSWVTIDPNTGVLTGTPGPADAGYYGDGTVPQGYKPRPAIRVKAVSDQGETEELTVNLVVTGPSLLKPGFNFLNSATAVRACYSSVGHTGSSVRNYFNGGATPTVEVISNIPGVGAWSEDNTWTRTDNCLMPSGINDIFVRMHNEYGTAGEVFHHRLNNRTIK